ncbi:MAG: hypothetical protein Q8P82_01465 [bacterium]|nr:hypothetical protein [bacterium]
MLLKKFFIKSTMPHTIRTYFGASWELWRREISRTLWDWGIDGPFCTDPHCSQRLEQTKQRGIWKCIRCSQTSRLPKHDLISIRSQGIKFFEEEAREKTELTLSW